MAREKKNEGVEEKDETPMAGFASLCSVLAVGLFVLTFVFQNFVIPSSSMASTLLVGDHVLVERVNLAPSQSWAPFVQHRDVRRGEVVDEQGDGADRLRPRGGVGIGHQGGGTGLKCQKPVW